MARAIQVVWMPVPESQVIGYHVYRKCEWDCCYCCYDGSYYSRETFACENSRIRFDH